MLQATLLMTNKTVMITITSLKQILVLNINPMSSTMNIPQAKSYINGKILNIILSTIINLMVDFYLWQGSENQKRKKFKIFAHNRLFFSAARDSPIDQH